MVAVTAAVTAVAVAVPAGILRWRGPRGAVRAVRAVEVEVESMDKAGNFIGWLHIEGVNLSVALVEQALSRVHFTAERSPYCKALLAAQDAAKQRKEKVWSHYEETPVEEVVPVLEEKERTCP
ncbi:unnamed protein product [Coccothraustes coccothraustes]